MVWLVEVGFNLHARSLAEGFDIRWHRGADSFHPIAMPQVASELHSRPPYERMMHIHACLKAGRYPNCSQLAKSIEPKNRS